MIWQKDIHDKPYIPILIERIHKDGRWVTITNNSSGITQGDILVITTKVMKLYVGEVYVAEDLFEDHLMVELSIISNDPAFFDIERHVDIGDEVKILSSSTKES